MRVKRPALTLLRFAALTAGLAGLAAGCRHPAPTPLPGAPAPRLAVESFLAAVKAQDLQAMSSIWGTREGPVRDSHSLGRDAVERRELIMMCFLGHDRYRLGGETPGEGGRRVFAVELTRGTISRSSNFFTVQGPSSRWYVESVDITPLQDLCRNPPGSAP